MGSTPRRYTPWSLLLCASVVGTPLAAQEAVAGVTLEPVVTDTFLVLVPYRPTDEIRADLDRVRQSRSSAELERERSRELEQRLDRVIEVQKRQIELIKAREDLAKDENREADRLAERHRRQQAELARKMLERRKDLRKSETEVAEAEQKASEARQKALEAELDLAQKRDEYDRVATRDSARAQVLARDITQLERRTLEARRDAASKERDYADRARKLAERRLSLHDAQEKLAGVTR